ncbi:MAG: hypothetical protein R3B91_03455 [Planctomycetaceae bacterium]
MSDSKTPRHFVLLGNENVPPLMKAVLQSDDREVIGLALVDRRQEQSDTLRFYDDWESLVADTDVDAVLINEPQQEVLDFARRLAARGKPLIVPAWPSLPPEFVAELSLFDAEGVSTFVPLFELRHDVEPLRRLIAEGRLGTVNSIQLDRTDVDVDDSIGKPSWYAGVRFEDLDWLRLLGGDYSQVTVIRSGGDDRDTFVTQTLQLAGPGLPDATCTYRRSKSGKRLQIRVDGSKGTAEFHLENEGDQQEVVISVDGEEFLRRSALIDPAEACETIDRSWRQEAGGAQWRDLVRIHEINEAMKRSFRRRRTIDLHFEVASERSQFKTQMATVGCFVLVYTFFASIVMLFAGAVLDPRDDLQRTSEAAGMILRRSEFDSSTDQLTPGGEEHLKEIAKQWQSSEAGVVIVEADSKSDPSNQLTLKDDDRLSIVRQRLSELGSSRIEERTVARPLSSENLPKLMKVGRLIAFAPLGLFLVMQLLLFVSRPARATHDNPKTPAKLGQRSSDSEE